MLSSLSLRNHCAYALYFAVCQWSEQNGLVQDPNLTPLACIQFIKLDPANSLQPGQGFITQYNCAIAHQLANDYSTDPEELAANLCQIWEKIPRGLITTGLIDADLCLSGHQKLALRTSTASQGWITLEVSWPGLLDWLVTISAKLANQIQTSWQANPTVQTIATQRLSPKQVTNWQYSHARCCSLLRQAEQAQLIRLFQPQVDNEIRFLGAIANPAPIPWQALMSSIPRCVAAERELLLQLITVIDGGGPPFTPQNVQRLLPNQIQNLCTSFNRFHQVCRILEPFLEGQTDLAQARIGLISITQQCLQILMQAGLGLKTPMVL